MRVFAEIGPRRDDRRAGNGDRAETALLAVRGYHPAHIVQAVL